MPCAREAIEVLLKTKAFVCKKVASTSGDDLQTGQVTWSRHPDVESAWNAAKLRCGFDTELK